MSAVHDTGSCGSGSSRGPVDAESASSTSTLPAVRDEKGHFLPGNQVGKAGGPGSPVAKRAHELRAVLFEAVTDDAMRAIVATLIDLAIRGDVQAAKLLMDRVVLRAPDTDADSLAASVPRIVIVGPQGLPSSLTEPPFEPHAWTAPPSQ